jgi:hypothetical protein
MSQDIEIDPDSRTIKYYDQQRVGEVSEDAIIEHIQAGGSFINNAQARFLLDEIVRLRKDCAHYKQAALDISDENDRLRKLVPPETERGPGFVGQGTWSVYAEKVVAERDDAQEEVRFLTKKNKELEAQIRKLGEELDAKKEHANCHYSDKFDFVGIDGYGNFSLKRVDKDRWEIQMLKEKVTLYNKKGHRVRGDHNYDGDW